MKNLLIKLLIINVTLHNMLLSDYIIVNTDIILVKKKPSDSSKTNQYYKRNERIKLLEKLSINNEGKEWYKIEKGYIKAKYIILENSLPKIIKEKDIDPNKFSIQLISYNSNAIKSLTKTKILLRNENNIYIKNRQKYTSVYLVNFDSYKKAKIKSQNLKKYFPSNYIIKIKTNENKSNKKDNGENNLNHKNTIIREYIKSGFQKNEKEEVINNKKNKNKEVVLNKKEEIVLEHKSILKRPDTSGKEKIKSSKIDDNSSKNSIVYIQMIEDILLQLSK